MTARTQIGRIRDTAPKPQTHLPKSDRPISGRHVLIVALAAFGVILGANITMIVAATGSFPGVVVKNSYVASQKFKEISATREALGWSLAVDYDDHRLTLTVTDREGAHVPGLVVAAKVGRPVDARTDEALTLADTGAAYAAPLALESGAWRIEVSAATKDGRAVSGETSFVLR